MTSIHRSLSMLSINVAEELTRLNKNLPTNLYRSRELSRLMKEKFNNRSDYKSIFKDAYHMTFRQDISKISDKKNYIDPIYKQLHSPFQISKKRLEKLIDFCVNLSNYFCLYDQELDLLKGEEQ